MRRCEEEIVLLRQEMRQYLSYFSDSLRDIEGQVGHVMDSYGCLIAVPRPQMAYA